MFKFSVLALATVLPFSALADGQILVGDVFDDPRSIGRTAIAEFYFLEEGLPHISVEMTYDKQDFMTVIITETGFADDSVAGSRIRYVLREREEGGWVVTETESLQKCYRTENKDWQKGPCV